MILSIPPTADAATIKKAHRQLALRHHPDKTLSLTPEEREQSACEFKLIQAAYECLSDPVERRWYDEHREMILRGGLSGGGGDGTTTPSFLFDVVPYQYAGCYDGYSDDTPHGFYSIYQSVFQQIFQGEKDGYVSEGNIDYESMSNGHLEEVSFGNSKSSWGEVSSFYSAWECFTSCLSFAWADEYLLDDLKGAPNRRIRRLMEEENKKKRKAAKRERIDEIYALVRFVKRRDPRVIQQREWMVQEQVKKEEEKRREAVRRKEEIAVAKEEWMAEAERTIREQEAADLDAGRIRLADLDSDDDDYGGGGAKRGRKKKGGKRRKGKKNRNRGNLEDDSNEDDDNNNHDDGTMQEGTESSMDPSKETLINDTIDMDDGIAAVASDAAISNETNKDSDETSIENPQPIDDASSIEESEEEEPDSWRCECCRKDFKSEKQFDNHVKSKKHKEMLKKYERKLQREAVADLLDDLG
ncbi:hypothetical protein HJC23_004964 [Cyclotella cryptica]|uniref:J domain-containing protein n=1 Tax=Cyclotella cryptica TaxID=29204 RepID=A0ABD3P811_9STRA